MLRQKGSKRFFRIFVAFILFSLATTAFSLPSAQAAVFFVNRGAAVGGDGSNWALAKRTITSALLLAEAGDELWVAQGTYPESVDMKSGVALYGGFTGNETTLDARDWEANRTIIDGSTARDGLPAYHVVVMDNLVNSRLDGFTVTGGKADGSWYDTNGRGGGIWVSGGDKTIVITHCLVRKNNASGSGGGLYLENSSATIFDCVISQNLSTSEGGGGVFFQDSSPTLNNCLINDNQATRGGGVGVNGASPALTNCLVIGNQAGKGGGIYSEGSSPTLANCTISNNLASSGDNSGGGLALYNSSPAITNCIVSGNHASTGGGIRCEQGSAPILTNNLFDDNDPDDYWNQDSQDSYTSAAVINTLVNSASGNLDGDPIFVMGPHGQWTSAPVYDSTTGRTTFTDSRASFSPGALKGRLLKPEVGLRNHVLIIDNTATAIVTSLEQSDLADVMSPDETSLVASGDTYQVVDCHLAAGSPAIDAGAASGVPNTDFDGQARPNGSCWDIGTDEYYKGYADVAPALYKVEIESTNKVKAFFTKAMGASALLASNYTVSGAGQGTLASQPNSVLKVDDYTYRLVWTSGRVENNQELTLTVAGVTDAGGTALGSPDSAVVTVNMSDALSQVEMGPAQTTLDFEVPFTFSTGDVGLASVRLFYSKDGGAWTQYGDTYTDSPISFDASTTGGEGFYEFYTLAVDNSGFEEAPKNKADDRTLVATSFSGSRLYVNSSLATSGSGSSWGEACHDIGAALVLAQAYSINEIWVAEGQYQESLTMVSDVSLYGGFTGTETQLSERDWKKHQTIIDGSTARGGSPAYHVVIIESLVNTRLDGFIITGGDAGDNQHGGGIYALYLNETNTIANCFVFGNDANWGGGIHFGDSSAILTDCVVSGNHTAHFGAGISVFNSSPTLTNCIISGNKTDGGGGGIGLYYYSSPTIVNCTISNNSANYNAGVYLYAADSNPNIANCVISDNINNSDSGGAVNFIASSGVLNNNLFYGNSKADVCDGNGNCYTGAEDINDNISTANNNIDGDPRFVMGPLGRWTAPPVYDSSTNLTTLTDGNGNFTADGLKGFVINPKVGQYTHSVIVSNTATTVAVYGDLTGTAAEGGVYRVYDYHLGFGSPAIDVGKDVGAPAKDFDGEARPNGPAVDIGADEYYPGYVGSGEAWLYQVQAEYSFRVKVTFSKSMGDGALDPVNYTVSGAGQGSLADHPDKVESLGAAVYRLLWNSGEMLGGGDVTITVADISDLSGTPIGERNSATNIGGGIGVAPEVTGVVVVSPTSVDATFSEAMGGDALEPAYYTLTGSGQGTLAINPDSVVKQDDKTYRLIWSNGEMVQGGDVTIAVVQVADALGNLIGEDNSAIHLQGGQGVPPEVLNISVVSSNTVDVTFNEAMGAGANEFIHYAMSGTGQGSLAVNPHHVELQGGNTYRLTWWGGEMFIGGDVTITVTGAADALGHLIAGKNSASVIGGGLGTRPELLGLADEPDIVREMNWTCVTTESNYFRYKLDRSPDWTPTEDYEQVSSYAWWDSANGYLSSLNVTLNSSTPGYSDGKWYLHVQSRDEAGNESAIVTVSAVLDNTPPTIIGLSDQPEPVTSVTWNWDADEPSVFIYSIDQDPNGSPPCCDYSDIKTATRSEMENWDATWYLHVKARDVAGNESTVKTVSAVIDTTGPTITGLDDSMEMYPLRSTTWTWGADDPQAVFRFAIDRNSSWTPIGDFGSVTTAAASKDLPEYSDGVWYLHVQGQDVLGNLGDVRTVSFNLDNTPPTIQGLADEADIVRETNWTCVTTESNYFRYKLDRSPGWTPTEDYEQVNSYTWWDSVSGYLYNLNITLDSSTPGYSDGKWYLHVQSRDEAGNESAIVTVSAVFDNTPPTIIGLSDQPEPATSVTWNWDADEPSVFIYSIDQDPNGSPPCCEYSDIKTASPSEMEGWDGTWYLHVKARDVAGNESAVKTVSAVIDATGPTITGLEDSMEVDSVRSKTWTWASDDPQATYRFAIDRSSSWTPVGDFGSVTTAAASGSLPNYADGTWYLHVQGSDVLGNLGQVRTVSVELDNTPPTIQGLADDPNPTRDKTWSWTNNEGNLFRYKLDRNQDGVPEGDYDHVQGCSINSDTIDYSDGVWFLHVQTRDDAGNESEVITVSAILDNTKPVISGLSDQTQGAASVTWNWDADESCTFLFSINQEQNSEPWGDYSDIKTATISDPDYWDGTWYLHVKARDLAGNESEVTTVSGVLDFSGPSITITGEPEGEAKVQSKIWQWSSDDPQAKFRFIIDQNLEWNDPTGEFLDVTTTTISGQTHSDGIWRLHVQARDAADNLSGVATVTVELDNTQPGVTNVVVVNSTSVEVAFTENMGNGITEPSNYTVGGSGRGSLTSHPDYVENVNEGVDESSTTYRLTWYVGEMYNGGDITITVANVTDIAGNVINENSGTAQGAGQGTPPTVQDMSNDDAPTQSKTWTWSSDDTEATFRYTIDQNYSWNPEGVFGAITTAGITKDSVGYTDGTWFIHVQARDQAGNESEVVTASVILDNTPPVVTVDDTSSEVVGLAVWNWQADEEATYCYQIDQSETWTCNENFVDVATASKFLAGKPGDSSEIWRLHVQARDRAGNISEVVHDLAQITPLTVSASPPGGIYYGGLGVTLTCNGDEAVIQYSVSGETPQTKYIDKIFITSSNELRYLARDGFGNSTTIYAQKYFIKTLDYFVILTTFETTEDETHTFEWNALEGAVCYQIQIADNQSYLKPLVDETVCDGATSYTPTDDQKLTKNGFYYWRVRAQDAYGNWTVWSDDYFFFTVEGWVRKAIIVAGRVSSADALWSSTQNTCDYAFIVLGYRGYEDDDIAYLTSDSKNSSRDGAATKTNLAAQIAAAGDANELLLFLHDHGGNGTFWLDKQNNESLTAAELDGWLDELQSDNPDIKITVIIEACFSGSFIIPLQGSNRIIITSSSSDEQSYLIWDGYISFSYPFWSKVFSNEDLRDA
ncbi:MAG: right-handed parallel beta-helix repeat-containing protein, partial [Pseudomonadota bacterium]